MAAGHPAALLALSMAALHDPAEGRQCLHDVIAGADLFAVTHAGHACLFYALRLTPPRAWLEAGAGHLPGVDLTREVLPLIERQAQAAGCSEIGITTKRRGLIAKLQRAGWRIEAPFYAGYTLKKALQ